VDSLGSFTEGKAGVRRDGNSSSQDGGRWVETQRSNRSESCSCISDILGLDRCIIDVVYKLDTGAIHHEQRDKVVDRIVQCLHSQPSLP